MKKTTYVLIALVALTFITQIAVFLFVRAHAVTPEEYRARHPEYFTDSGVDDDDDYISFDAPADSVAATTIDASDGGYRVTIISDGSVRDAADGEFFTDTLIITSSEKNIRVTSKIR